MAEDSGDRSGTGERKGADGRCEVLRLWDVCEVAGPVEDVRDLRRSLSV